MDTRRQWSLLTGLVCLAVLAIGWLFVVTPQRHQVQSLHRQTTTQNRNNDGLRVKLAELRSEQRQLPTQLAALRTIQGRLPVGLQLPTLARQLDAAAKASGVDLVNVTPAASVPVTAPGAAAGGVTVVAPSTVQAPGGLEAIPVSLSVSGNYANVERFVEKLEDLSRAMVVDTFTITYQKADASAAAGPNKGDLAVVINARAFLTNGTPAATATHPTTGGGPATTITHPTTGTAPVAQ